MKLIFWCNLIFLVANYEGRASKIPVFNSVPVSGRKGMVTSDAPICSELGSDVLQNGGNAIDASVTTTLCQGVVYPFASGIGGGGYMLIYKRGKDPIFVNFRERAPKLANETMYKNNTGASTLGGLAVAIPGEVKGLEWAHKKFGKLPWQKVVEPVVKLALEGFEVPLLLTQRIKENLQAVNASEGLRLMYYPGGQIPQNGTIFKNAALGATLKKVQELGSKALYEGPVAKRWVQVIQKNGGIITEEDIKNYEPSIAPGIKGTFRGRDVFSIPPPGSGAVVIAALNIFENFANNITYDASKAHRIAETLKHAYSFRLNFGDPKFVPNVEKVVKSALSKKEARERFQKINDKITYEPNYYTKSAEKAEDHGTSHVNVLDAEGLAVSVTSTINTAFGSKVLDPETGVLFNNEMDDFSSPDTPNYFNLPPSESNFIRPGKVPQSSMAPTVLTDRRGNVEFLVGSSGGSYIPSSIIQVILNLIDEELSPAEAVAAPRIHHQLIPNEIKYESGFDKTVLEGLKTRNHTLKYTEILASAGVIRKSKDRLWGAADTRKLGIAYSF